MKAFRTQEEDGGQQANSLDPPSKQDESGVVFSLSPSPYPISRPVSAEPSKFTDGDRWAEPPKRTVTIQVPGGRRASIPASIPAIAELDTVKSLKRETRLFVLITALHGVRRVWESRGKSKAFWGAACLVMAGLMFWQTGVLLSNYIEEPTVSQVSFVMAEEGMDFPKITICSYNPIRKSYIEKINTTGDFTVSLTRYLMLANNDIYKTLAVSEQELEEADREFYLYKLKNPNFTINDFYMEAGLSCEEVLKVCTFAGQSFPCCRYSSPVLTSLGLCHAIHLRAEFDQPVMKQTEGVETAGLQIILDSHNDESLVYPLSSSILSSPLENGFRFYVDEPETSTYSSSQGISVSPGDVVYSAVSLTKYNLLDAENYGYCSSTWPSEYTGRNTLMKYQSKDCLSKCKAKYLFENCGCSPFIYNIDKEYPSCTPLQNYQCLQSHVIGTNGTADRWPKCEECVTECNKWVYGTSNSYGRGFSDASVLSLRMANTNWTDEYIKTNILSMSVFFRDLSYTEYAQVTSSTFVQLLSNIGGTFGLFLGMSVLTVFEIIIYAAKVSWMFISCQRRQYTARKERKKKMEKVETEKAVKQITSLSAINLEGLARSMNDDNNKDDSRFLFTRDSPWSTPTNRSSIHSELASPR